MKVLKFCSFYLRHGLLYSLEWNCLQAGAASSVQTEFLILIWVVTEVVDFFKRRPLCDDICLGDFSARWITRVFAWRIIQASACRQLLSPKLKKRHAKA